MNANVWQISETPSMSTSQNSPIINDNKNESIPIIFCVTCLSTSDVRKMYPIKDKALFSYITFIQVPKNSNLKVCWECNAILEKIKEFKRRAFKARHIMSREVIKLPAPLTTLVHKNLNSWLSIAYKSQIEINPLNENTLDTPIDTSIKETPIDTSVKEEFIETETVMSDAQDSNLIEEDPFLLHTEVEIKNEDSTKEDEQGCMDILKCEYDSSSDDEPLITKAKTHLEIINHNPDDESDTDSATDSPIQHPKPIFVDIYPSVPKDQSISDIPKSLAKPPSLDPKVSDTTSILELPLAFVASSLLTSSLRKPAESATQTKSGDKDKQVQYHSGPKLFKNSPQLAIPEMFRNVEPPKQTNQQTTCTIKRMTEQQVNEYRAERLEYARKRHWHLFCVKCLDKFSKPQEYKAHLKNHNKSAGQYVCSICLLRFPTQKELDEHKELHYRLYVCDVCEEQFYTSKSLIRHNDLVHADVTKFCRHCDKRFTNNKEYYMHNRTHIKTVKCEQCDKEMKRDTLKQHIKDSHCPRPFLECEICHKMVDGKKKLRNHMRNSHRPTEDSAYCVECNVWFKTQAHYNTHLKTTMKHKTDQEKFKCAECDRIFSTPWYLKKHIRVIHENRELSQCDICQKVYKCKKAVRSHIMKFHLKLKTPSERRDKVCDFCGKAFMTKSCLEQHRNSHLKIRPYKCEECGASFSYSGARYTHIKLKHRKKQATAES